MKKIILLFFAALSLVSCGSSIVISKDKNAPKPKKIVLMATMIGNINRPIFPVLFASKFNNKTIALANDLNKLKAQNIDSYRTNLARSLEKNLGCQVIFGDALISSDEYKNLKLVDNPTALNTGDEHFPKIIRATNDVNPFTFESGKALKYFNSKNDHKEIMAKICKELNSDYLAISYSELKISKIVAFGNKANANLETFLILFDKNGELVKEGMGWSNPLKTNGNQIKDYEFLLQEFETIIEPVTRKMNSSFKK